MSRLSQPLALAVALAATLSGCSRDTEAYPSLAPRPVEKLGFAEPETKPIELKADPVLDATIADKRRQLATIAQGFATAAARTGPEVGAAKGKPVGSDAWLDAQTSLGTLDDWRAQLSALATEVDALIQQRAEALAPIYPTLAPLRDDVATEAASETATIDRLQATLPAA